MSTRDKSITDRGLVRLAGVRKRFLEGSRRTGRDDYTDHYALWNVDLEIDRGDVVGIIGQSGAGKTTLARVMLLLTRPSQGEVYYGRRRVDNLARHEVREVLRRKFHLVFQDPDAALNPMMSVGQIMEEAIRLRTEIRGKKHIRDHGLTLLSGLELRDGTWDALPHQLSGGEKKRVAVARALLGRPDMILADEPFAGLDLAVAMRILNTLRRLRAEVGTALLFISHDIDIVLKASDRVAVLYRGRVLETGPSRQVSEAPQHPYTRFLLGLDRRVEPTAVSNPTCVFAHRCPQCLLCMNNGARKGMEPRYVPVGPDHLVLCHKAGQFPSKGRSPVDK